MSTRICVVGCGAVGSLFAAHLAQLEETEVLAYDLSRPHVDAINRDGLRIVGKANLVARLRATDDAAELPPCDFGIVATKGYATAPAIEATAHCFAEGYVASVQNGVGNEEVIAARIGAQRVLLGTTFPAGHLVEPGVVAMDTTGDTWLGPFGQDLSMMPAVERLADLLTRSGMPTKALPDARGAQWNKLVFNAATNPLGALTGLTHGEVCEQPGLRRLVSGLIDEALAVATALGIVVDGDPEALVDHAAVVAHDHRASMLQDVAARRRTEIDSLNGGIATLGRSCGVATPLNDAIVALVEGLEASYGVRRTEHDSGASSREGKG
ncbi:MAG: 2-dehydropantoate 2-reductase [Actinomycetota bacterium]|jgi:2-dehydropantoate 2-reductase|nr:2-dehydropantoate 2-reductase [Actinomycetota bacterium]